MRQLHTIVTAKRFVYTLELASQTESNWHIVNSIVVIKPHFKFF